MTKSAISPVEQPRFTEEETFQLLTKLATICASIEAQWEAINESDSLLGARHLDTILILAQVGGFIADHGGGKPLGYGDVFSWLEIPEGKKGAKS